MNNNTFIELFHESVEKYGEKTALRDPAQGRSLSYKELEEYSGRIASKLKNMGQSMAAGLPSFFQTVLRRYQQCLRQ